MSARKNNNPGGGGGSETGIVASKVKVRYGETRMVRDMRENFQKKEKIALRSSKTYR